MSLMDMIKGLGAGRARSGGGSSSPVGFDGMDSQLAGAGAGAGGAGLTLPVMHATRSDPETYAESTLQQVDTAESSIITEAAPSDLGAYAEAQEAQPADAAAIAGLPFIGHRPLESQQRILGGAVIVGIAGLLLMMFLALNAANKNAVQLNASGQALMQSQRLAKAVSQAVIGNVKAFGVVRESSEALSRSVYGLQSGDAEISAAPSAVQEVIEPVIPLVEGASRNASVVLAHQKVLTQVGQALQTINRQSSELLQTAETVSLLKLQQEASASELSAAGQLVMLTQRIGKSTNEFLTAEGASQQSMMLLGKDLKSFREIGTALLEGSSELRLPAARDAQSRAALSRLLNQYEETRVQAGAILDNLPDLLAVRKAQAAIVAESEPLRQGLEEVQTQLSQQGGFAGWKLGAMLLFGLLMVAGGFGFLRLFMLDQSQRAAVSETQRLQAERMEQEAKRVNDANQAAILRLMNELQSVAEGDLTQQATVTEDITGAIADSVNYTVEELRTLVSQVQGTVGRVTDTTQQVEATSTELMAASSEQLREIRDTGESVLQMAGRINDVSAQAQQTAQVARQSLAAAESGLHAVQNTIGGMNSIRDQIQDTSKRIKRLGESSQEIGEITELISDITEQTNVLALNAAIQAASAGEAGRGFSVVAEEVQRLAERSGDATRQIAALVKTIQTDTQDAVGAMERSTQGVVEGTHLSDAAGTALVEIDRVSRRLAELIEQISSQASSEAKSANVVAANIQHIFAVTEQTGEGTRSTAQMVRELSKTAEELSQSVARFKIA